MFFMCSLVAALKGTAELIASAGAVLSAARYTDRLGRPRPVGPRQSSKNSIRPRGMPGRTTRGLHFLVKALQVAGKWCRKALKRLDSRPETLWLPKASTYRIWGPAVTAELVPTNSCLGGTLAQISLPRQGHTGRA